MDSSQSDRNDISLSQGGVSEDEILLTGKCLLELLRKNLCPGYVRDRDGILLTAPWEEADYRVGVYLYDI